MALHGAWKHWSASFPAPYREWTTVPAIRAL